MRGAGKELWIAILIGAIAASIALTAADTAPVTAQVPEVAARYINGSIPLDPNDPLWSQAEKVQVPLVAQLIVYPLSIDTTPKTIRVSTLHNGTHIAFYIEWDDRTRDVEGVSGDLSSFGDAVAIQFPATSKSLPYICMGDTANPVNIVFWKAGRGVENLIAGSAYGRDAREREALGLHQVPTSPIEKLPSEAQVWVSNSVYSNGKWRVVLIRPTGSTYPLIPELKPGDSVSVAFARWEGSNNERGGAKSTSGWFTVKLEQPVVGRVETITTTVPGPTVTTTISKVITTTATETVTETLPAVTGAVKGALVGLIAALIAAIMVLVIFYRKGMFGG